MDIASNLLPAIQNVAESLVNKKIKIDKVIQHLMKVTTPKEYKKYHTRAIISRGWDTFYPLFEVHLCNMTFGLMYG